MPGWKVCCHRKSGYARVTRFVMPTPAGSLESRSNRSGTPFLLPSVSPVNQLSVTNCSAARSVWVRLFRLRHTPLGYINVRAVIWAFAKVAGRPYSVWVTTLVQLANVVWVGVTASTSRSRATSVVQASPGWACLAVTVMAVNRCSSHTGYRQSRLTSVGLVSWHRPVRQIFATVFMECTVAGTSPRSRWRHRRRQLGGESHTSSMPRLPAC